MPSAVCCRQALDMEPIKALKTNSFCPASSGLVRNAGFVVVRLLQDFEGPAVSAQEVVHLLGSVIGTSHQRP